MSRKMTCAETAREIGAAMTQLGKDLEVEGESYRKIAYSNARERLAKVLVVDEALGLVRLAGEDRQQCRSCTRNVPVSRIVGNLCRGCSLPWTQGASL